MEYTFMNQNMEVFDFLYDEEIHNILKITRLIHPEYAPLGVIEYQAGISKKLLNHWWKDRSIPASRSKFKEVLEDLDICSSVELLEKCYGLSLSDQYWIKEKNSPITWESINFFTNEFSEDMGKLLMGQITYSNDLDLCSPDNSSDGNLRKKWKIIHGKRCLLKSGNTLNNQEPYNEVIATKLYERILNTGDYVPYKLIEEDGIVCSCCETMVSINEELVPAYYIDQTMKLKGSDSLYEHYLMACEGLGIPHVKQQVHQMIVCDYILANYDRHYRNFGAIRNVKDLTWKQAAPIFDSGSSLWAMTPTSHIGEPYRCKPFHCKDVKQLHLVNDLSWLCEERLIGFEQDVIEVLQENPLIEEARRNAIAKQVHIRINAVLDYKKTLHHS